MPSSGPRTTDGDGGDGGANAYTGGGPSGSRLALPSLGQSNAHASSSALSLSLAIPSSGAFSSSSGYGSSDGQDEAPWETGGAATNFASTASSIYPDTVMGNTGNGPAALAEDLRRAIGGMQLEDGVGAGAEGSRQEGQGEYGSQAQPSGSSARGSAGSTPGIGAPFGVGPRSGEGESSADGEEPVLKGNLEILARLGEGASGEVKKARHKPSGLLMAKKVRYVPEQQDRPRSRSDGMEEDRGGNGM